MPDSLIQSDFAHAVPLNPRADSSADGRGEAAEPFRDVIARILSEHAAGGDPTHRLWSLLWLELWWRMFVERSLKSADGLKG